MASCDLCIGHCPAGVVGVHGVRHQSGETFKLCISEHIASREGGPSAEASVGRSDKTTAGMVAEWRPLDKWTCTLFCCFPVPVTRAIRADVMSVLLRLTSCRVISMSALGYEGQEVSVHIPCLLSSLTSLLSRAGSGTIYFTSIRKEKGVPFTVRTFCSIMFLSLNLSLTNTFQSASKLSATMELLFTFRTLFLSRLLLSTETLSLKCSWACLDHGCCS